MNFFDSLVSVLGGIVGFIVLFAVVIGVLESGNITLLIGLVIFMVFCLIVYRGKRHREQEEKARNKRIFDSIDAQDEYTDKPQEIKTPPQNQDFILNSAESISGLLNMQLALLTHIKGVKEKRYTIGYIFGFIDGCMQLNKVDINDDISTEVTFKVLSDLYPKKVAIDVLEIYQTETKAQSAEIMLGMKAGGEEWFKYVKGNKTIMGLCDYFMEEGELISKDTQSELEARLRDLNSLYDKGLITKKNFDEKQRQLLAEL